jgi:hypothetical protein
MGKIVSYVLLLLLIHTATVTGAFAGDSVKERYVAGVISILHHHAESIRLLSKHNIKYSNNLARHASGLKQTFGLLGPMDWHAAKAATLQRGDDSSLKLQPADFEMMARSCQEKIKKLHKTAVMQVETGIERPIVQILDSVQSSCEECHNLLEGIDPNVWQQR